MSWCDCGHCSASKFDVPHVMYGSESLYEFLDWFPRLEGHAFHGHEILTWLRVRT